MVFLDTISRSAALFARRLHNQSSHFFVPLCTGLYQLQNTDDIDSRNFKLFPFSSSPYIIKSGLLYTTACDSVESLQEQIELETGTSKIKDSAEIFREWGCSESDISKIFERRPSLRKADTRILQSKLELLSHLGIKSTDLVKMIHCRPRFLNCKLNVWLNERLEYLEVLFGSREVLVKAIVRNPSLLTYDFQNKIKPVIAMYESIGLSKGDLIAVLLSRPTLIPRTSLDDEKIDYIRKTGVSKHSKMYKHVVSLFAISRIDTIREKMMNLEKFGLLEDEILNLMGRSPLILTLSIDKVQRHMTFVLGTMKLSASVVLRNPFLLYFNLETVLKPRFQIACKIEDMELVPQIKGPLLLTALRMSEKRFISVFITCHPENVAEELITTYKNAKCVRRLAESSKKYSSKGFPF
ncbi:Mitochondrial transcription termination factor, mTERF [Handroanthus impetiginosus]|uniref:Mitochondrial transcription termination factor, mTERF n=1 Tax=Handroanthus impetiginosus TaxID=429701 RepID=A0A2G9GXJ1_9LAMI|nr:Mitochondrial transcription termination factor, mTERF [Handroanthus impetiginosus]